jgi:insulysin
MLFLGTRKYPDEDEYETFLSQFGGFSNAYTDMEDTNYFFSVTTDVNPNQVSEALVGGLDRLAQFFIAPTFDRDAVDRELRAIDSEYRNGKTSDAWRNFQLLKSSCDQRHPFSNFGCGNYETLMSKGLDNLLDELENFWKTFYQSYNLRLSVVGHASLDELQKTVEETFGGLAYSEGAPRHIRSRPDQVFSREGAVYDVTAFGPEQLAVVRKVIPFTESRGLKINFSTPPMDDPEVNKCKPHRVISHILGHESPGSLHALLNDEGYINGLSSGTGIDVSDFSLFTLTISLTPKGMKEKDKVLDLVFQWIALLRENQDKLVDYHDELRLLSDTHFRFRENGDPTDFVSTASELLFGESERARILLGDSEADDLDPVMLQAMMDRFRPSNCMISILDSDLDASKGEWKTEERYGARYQTEPLTKEQLEAWEHPANRDERLKLPALNKYIPTDFSLRCDDRPDPEPMTDKEIDVPPKLLIDLDGNRMWHKMDRFWKVPKGFVRVALFSAKIYQTPRTMTYSRIFQRVLNDDLNSFVYDASLAGCSYSVICTPYGYRLSVRGYNERLSFLLDTLTTRILSLIEEMKDSNVALEDKFNRAKEGLLRETKNYRLDPPYEVANYNSRLFIEENVWYLDNYIDEMEGINAERFPLTMKECAEVTEECLMGRVRCEALCMGNIDEAGAREVYQVIDRHFLKPAGTLSEVENPRFRSMKLPTKEEAIMIFGAEVADKTIPLVHQDVALSDSEENNAIELILQVASELELGYEGMAVMDLICHIAYNSAFGQLRTKEQLGYIVQAFARKTAGNVWGMSVVVQSSVALPEVLEERCEAWLGVFRKELEKMAPESIAAEASAVVAQLLETETKLSQEVSGRFGAILNTEGLSDKLRTPSFDRLEKLAVELTVGDDKDNPSMKTPAQLKERVLAFFDKYFAADSPSRRCMSTRVYNQDSKSNYEASVGKPGILSTYSDMRHCKQYLSSWPSVPYWRIEPKD